MLPTSKEHVRTGMHPRVAQERLEHSTITATLATHSHVAPVTHEDAAEPVAGMFLSRLPHP